jgi:hypothetical protein
MGLLLSIVVFNKTLIRTTFRYKYAPLWGGGNVANGEYG